MEKRALAALLSAWIILIVALLAAATLGFYTHLNILDNPESGAQKLLNDIGPEDFPPLGGLLRHQAASAVKLEYIVGEFSQILLGISVLALYLVIGRIHRLRLGALALTLMLTFGQFVVLRPRVERAISEWEFAMPGEIYVKRDTMFIQGSPYVAVEVLKVVLITYVFFGSLISESDEQRKARKERRRRSRRDEDEVRALIPYR